MPFWANVHHLPMSSHNLVIFVSTPLQTMAENRPLSKPLWERIRRELLSWLQSATELLDVTKRFTLWLQSLSSAISLNRAWNGPHESYPAAVYLKGLICMLSNTDPLSWWQAWTSYPSSPSTSIWQHGNDAQWSTTFHSHMTSVSSASVFNHLIKTTKKQIAASLYHHLLVTSIYCYRYCNYYNLS